MLLGTNRVLIALNNLYLSCVSYEKNFLVLGILIVALIAGKQISDINAEVTLTEKTWHCGSQTCDYSFELANNPDFAQIVQVIIHFRAEQEITSYKNMTAILPSHYIKQSL